MKPPVCRICDNDLRTESGGIVYFKKNEKDIEWDKKMDEEEMVGHPPYCDWFCHLHYKRAKELQHLEITEAVRIIKEEF